jgi:Cu-processing system permease protein
MRAILIISFNTFREIIRDRILYGLIIFALLLIGLSLALGQLSFEENARITMDFGFASIHMSSVILSIFVGSTLVAREIEKKTIMTLLARSITRLQFLVGKCLGLILVTLTVILGLTAVLILVLSMMGYTPNGNFYFALWGILLEAIVLLATTLFFGMVSKPMLAASFALGVFLIGHWIDSLNFFAKKSESQAFMLVERFFSYAIPNLERFNWRSLVHENVIVSSRELSLASLYALIWIVILVTASSLIFRRRDFV